MWPTDSIKVEFVETTLTGFNTEAGKSKRPPVLSDTRLHPIRPHDGMMASFLYFVCFVKGEIKDLADTSTIHNTFIPALMKQHMTVFSVLLFSVCHFCH